MVTVVAQQGTAQRRRFIIQGIVQGVGFRPCVYRLATALHLSGWVCNAATGVIIEVQGDCADNFIDQLVVGLPPLAQIHHIQQQPIKPIIGDSQFLIQASESGDNQSELLSDQAICEACLTELFDSRHRLYHYPFISCTDCGPRYSIIEAMPYDRQRTSMHVFPMCAECLLDFNSPSSRRFHEQAISCKQCGPCYRHSIDDIAAWIRRGDIVAIKGLGGYQLLCDATQQHVIARLRQRKQRPSKPLALMMLNADSVRHYANVSSLAEQTLMSAARPIVLLPKRASIVENKAALILKRKSNDLAANLSEKLDQLGVMLPSTPLYYMLFHALLDKPQQSAWWRQLSTMALVVTSGNISGSAIIADDAIAQSKLSAIADHVVAHSRNIVNRVDDSVVGFRCSTSNSNVMNSNINGCSSNDKNLGINNASNSNNANDPATLPKVDSKLSASQISAIDSSVSMAQLPKQNNGIESTECFFIRRARGFAPSVIQLGVSLPPILALGSALKNTICIAHDSQAFISPYIGDLNNINTINFFHQSIDYFLGTISVKPEFVVHDLHPDGYPARVAVEFNCPTISVQHHHAHIASIAAEHQWQSPALALALDGYGYGDDGGSWGGELLHYQGRQCQRLASLRPLPLVGGDQAAKQPWRVALAVDFLLQQVGATNSCWFDAIAAEHNVNHRNKTMILTMLENNVGVIYSSSCGRLFDAASALLGVCLDNKYEGQAAMQLESLVTTPQLLSSGWRITDEHLDMLPLLQQLYHCDAVTGANLFHGTLAAALADWVYHYAKQLNLNTVILGGGCFQNRKLINCLCQHLGRLGVNYLLPKQLPANDGGISLGQAWVAALQA